MPGLLGAGSVLPCSLTCIYAHVKQFLHNFSRASCDHPAGRHRKYDYLGPHTSVSHLKESPCLRSLSLALHSSS